MHCKLSLSVQPILLFTDKNLSATVADIFIAGSETTSTTLNWAILYLIANPDIQEKLHKEIISVIGAERSPSLSDRPK